MLEEKAKGFRGKVNLDFKKFYLYTLTTITFILIYIYYEKGVKHTLIRSL